MFSSEGYVGPFYTKGEAPYYLFNSPENFKRSSLSELVLLAQAVIGKDRVTWHYMLNEIARRLDDCDQTSDEYLTLLEAFYAVGETVSAETHELRAAIEAEQAQVAQERDEMMRQLLGEQPDTAS